MTDVAAVLNLHRSSLSDGKYMTLFSCHRQAKMHRHHPKSNPPLSVNQQARWTDTPLVPETYKTDPDWQDDDNRGMRNSYQGLFLVVATLDPNKTTPLLEHWKTRGFDNKEESYTSISQWYNERKLRGCQGSPSEDSRASHKERAEAESQTSEKSG